MNNTTNKMKTKLIIGVLIISLILIAGCGTTVEQKIEHNKDTHVNNNPIADNSNIAYECSSNSDCSSNEQCTNGKCIQIIKTNVMGHSRSDPSPINTAQSIHFGYSWSQITDAEFTLLNVKRGNSAWNAVKEANMFNEAPKEGQEYLLAKFRVKIIKTSDGEVYDLSSYNFDLVSSDGVVYDDSFIVTPEPSIAKQLYPGATNEGWVAFVVNKNDLNPLISFNRDGGGDDSLWFKLN